MSEAMVRARRVVSVGAAALVVVLVALAAAAWRLVEEETTSAATRGRVVADAALEDFARALADETWSLPPVVFSGDGAVVDPPAPRRFAASPAPADREGAFWIDESQRFGGELGRRALRRALRSDDPPTRLAAAAAGARMELRDGTGRAREWAAAAPPTSTWSRDAVLTGLVASVPEVGPDPAGDAVLRTICDTIGTFDETEAVAMVAALAPWRMSQVVGRRHQRADAEELRPAFARSVEYEGKRRIAMLPSGGALAAATHGAGWRAVRVPFEHVCEAAHRVFDPRGLMLVRAMDDGRFVGIDDYPLHVADAPRNAAATEIATRAAVEAPGGSGWYVAASFAEAEKRSRSTLLLAGLGVAGLAAVGAFAAFARAVRRDARLSTLRTEFVATVSHELRTPVAVVRTSAETLASGRATRDADKQALTEAIVRESERLSTLVGNVLDFARMESGRRTYAKRTTDVGALVRDVASRHAGVAVEIADDVPSIACDADALGAAVGNLLDNARKYSTPEAPVAVRVTSDKNVTYHSVAIEVIDHGIGVPDAEKPHVFERFFRGADPRVRETRGAGIGLALVKHAAEAHGGRVEIADTPGGGATFRVVLPIGEDG
jgi:signal transduction histidine kinase